MTGRGTISMQSMLGENLSALEVCLRLAAAFRLYWEWQGNLIEGRYWLKAALDLPLEDEAGRSVRAARAKVLSEASRLVCLQNDQAQAIELAEESVALWKELDNPAGLGIALLHRGWAAHAQGDYETAQCVYQEGIDHLPPGKYPWVRAQLLFHLAAADGFCSDFAHMRICYAEARGLFEQLGDKNSVADLLKDQGGLLILEGNYQGAINHLLTSIRLCYEMDHKQFIATGMGSLFFAIGLRGKPDPATASIHAAQIQGASDGLLDMIGLNPWTRTLPLAQALTQHLRSRVDEQSWQDAWNAGRAHTIEQAIELASRLEEG